MKQKGFAPLIVLIILGVLTAGGFFVYKSLKGKNESLGIIPAQTPTVSPTTTTEASTASTATGSRPKETPKPTIKSIPVANVDNSFYCGKYDSVSHPSLPARGSVPLLVSLSPSGGTSQGVSLAGWQWDYDGDGNWDTDKIIIDPNDRNSNFFLHTYSTTGTLHPKFRVVGNNGSVGPTCTYPFDVVVGGSLAYQNDTIAIDKLSFEYTVSKSKQNFSPPWYEKPFSNESQLIYMPAFNVSSKNKFTFVSYKEYSSS